ncbi:hypothetical protein L228DRAFT_86597 [Xylona heveae TC161]|uniref:Uncharacterized protein n=1 Tax=Xylona heveae (strain CBS 132557 / TC161) TaxID=1328760 RepID=A0A161TPB5_XYLHT|nr:hypothetical protein L228DRAFT_86597 [Xylona heveae TC161]KZF24006.1 hypothetical protein L228DRAFT_86597 [Xylona heveae TC161]
MKVMDTPSFPTSKTSYDLIKSGCFAQAAEARSLTLLNCKQFPSLKGSPRPMTRTTRCLVLNIYPLSFFLSFFFFLRVFNNSLFLLGRLPKRAGIGTGTFRDLIVSIVTFSVLPRTLFLHKIGLHLDAKKLHDCLFCTSMMINTAGSGDPPCREHAM